MTDKSIILAFIYYPMHSHRGLIFRSQDGSLWKHHNGINSRIDMITSSQTGLLINASDETKKSLLWCLCSMEIYELEGYLANLMDKNIFQVQRIDHSSLNPLLVVKFLQQFGFCKFQEYDSKTNMELWKIEGFDTWFSNRMEKTFTSDKVRSMFKREDPYSIVSYLKLLVHYINANPAILNRNYFGEIIPINVGG